MNMEHPPEQFYKDYGDPHVRRLARAIATRRGANPDMMVDDSSYPGAVQIPLWWKYQDIALAFIAMWETMRVLDR